MDEPALQRLLDEVQSGECSPDDAVHRLRRLPFADLGFAKVDHHRSLRQGLPEAVYGQGKTEEQCSAIVGELLGADGDGGPVILTRADVAQVERAGHRAPRRGSARSPGRQPGRTGSGASCRWWCGAPPRPGWPGPWWSPPAPPTCRWPASARPR